MDYQAALKLGLVNPLPRKFESSPSKKRELDVTQLPAFKYSLQLGKPKT